MGQRVTDHRREVANGRLKHFVELDRRDGSETHHPGKRSLDRRPASRNSVERLRQYLRIERGWLA